MFEITKYRARHTQNNIILKCQATPKFFPSETNEIRGKTLENSINPKITFNSVTKSE